LDPEEDYVTNILLFDGIIHEGNTVADAVSVVYWFLVPNVDNIISTNERGGHYRSDGGRNNCTHTDTLTFGATRLIDGRRFLLICARQYRKYKTIGSKCTVFLDELKILYAEVNANTRNRYLFRLLYGERFYFIRIVPYRFAVSFLM